MKQSECKYGTIADHKYVVGRHLPTGTVFRCHFTDEEWVKYERAYNRCGKWFHILLHCEPDSPERKKAYRNYKRASKDKWALICANIDK